MTIKTMDFERWWQLAPSGLVVLDERGTILQINQTLVDLLGCSRKRLIHQPASVLFTTESHLLYQGVLAFRLSAIGVVDEVHLHLQGTNGNAFPVLCSARRLDAPDPPLTLLAMVPIVRKDQLEQELLEARQAAQNALKENKLVINELEAMRVKLESHNQELQRLTMQLSQEARSDPLTDLPNRRHFELALEERFARASINRHSDVFSVAILDIDHFKPINDTYGHAVGDEVLQQLALLLSSQMRGSDLAARIGGEEFALLMPETSLEEASHALERLRLAIEAHSWQPVPITASIGVAGYQAGDTKENLMARADRALYEAKHLGRNHVAKS